MNRALATVAIAVGQLTMVALAVAPQLSARLSGDTFLMRVAPVDPIDPLRGTYVDLDYPDLRADDAPVFDDGVNGDLYVTLEQKGDTWLAGRWTRARPGDGPYLACDDRSWQVRCGIESWFLPQDEATRVGRLLRDGAVAEVRVDGRGNATVVGVRAP